MCEAHITAISGKVKESSWATESDTAAWRGFIDERANRRWFGSPAHAKRRPARSDTAT